MGKMRDDVWDTKTRTAQEAAKIEGSRTEVRGPLEEGNIRSARGSRPQRLEDELGCCVLGGRPRASGSAGSQAQACVEVKCTWVRNNLENAINGLHLKSKGVGERKMVRGRTRGNLVGRVRWRQVRGGVRQRGKSVPVSRGPSIRRDRIFERQGWMIARLCPLPH